MAYVTPGTVAAGDVATAAAWNVVVGDIVDHELYVSAIRTGLVDYTTTLAQGVSTNISKTSNLSKYCVVGKTMFIWLRIFATAAGTAGSAITVTIPSGFTINGASDSIVGSGAYGDSGSRDYVCQVYAKSTTTLALVTCDQTALSSQVGISPNIAVANNDSIIMMATIPIT